MKCPPVRTCSRYCVPPGSDLLVPYYDAPLHFGLWCVRLPEDPLFGSSRRPPLLCYSPAERTKEPLMTLYWSRATLDEHADRLRAAVSRLRGENAPDPTESGPVLEDALPELGAVVHQVAHRQTQLERGRCDGHGAIRLTAAYSNIWPFYAAFAVWLRWADLL